MYAVAPLAASHLTVTESVAGVITSPDTESGTEKILVFASSAIGKMKIRTSVQRNASFILIATGCLTIMNFQTECMLSAMLQLVNKPRRSSRAENQKI